MPLFLKQGNTFHVKPKESIVFQDTLPAGTYSVKYSVQEGFYLETIQDMTVPPKLYGNTTQNADRICKPFWTGPPEQESCSWEKKAKVVSANARTEQGIPTLVVNTSDCAGEAFNTFIQSIDQPAILLLDEFEKVFNRGSHQQKLLTLLDGLYNSKNYSY